MIKKLFYKFFVCKIQGHIFVNTQEDTWRDYYKQVCKHCEYTDGVKFPSPVTMEPQMDGTLKISIGKNYGGGGGGSGGAGTITKIIEEDNDR